MVDYYGSDPAPAAGRVQRARAPDALVQPYDKGAMKAIEKAISRATSGSTRGRRPGHPADVPQLTEERRGTW
jgi:ribosome recycling factor